MNKSRHKFKEPDLVNILAIESSCDDTSAAVIQNGKILSNIIASQSVHEKYGGVVPELASRAHQQNIVPVVHQALSEANITKTMLSGVAFTQGPGLLGSLLVGTSFAKSLAYALDIPLLAVDHMQAHILAHFIDDPKPTFPFLCLTVSGGHTQIVKVNNYLDMEILGETQDDAVGEAFDKCAKLMGLPYPGGPYVDQLAHSGDPKKYAFPMTHMPDLQYSFSGIKTAFLNFLKNNERKDPDFIEKNKADIAASIQNTLIEMLLQKLLKASQKTNIREIAIAGGVSANSELRDKLEEESVKNDWTVYLPKLAYCTDNAAMIAMTAHYLLLEGKKASLRTDPDARLHFMGH
ncbi:tRNA (adenosine(37)-N6)-threonylcarbamoyltransferase complex transferase subunit TsaD [Catalinimonas niigatensis]|uniref:tRNA (adenosine(37)-N6)-threonylcarbamoyltransferase complex transferase subunit TsaD n=1 Tax=Catalinimonas niigatensis TaxID=1397264 RepID=UPI002664EAFB|nr:tRNA (adenosine(37)-N6)-threonylcarbamoyltransferase complex transferase subunit TsaD [Catalinimonas niigatensis]WPP50236.1 tRNA (adenosine(37)-N6)-threonylcarbamoyltransferase complex transferase subunit TsaD [Catalinimonas niigatensis]